MQISMKPKSALHSSAGRPSIAAAAMPRFTCHALPLAIRSPFATATATLQTRNRALVPSNTHFMSTSSSSTVSCKYTSLPERMGEQEDNPSAAVPHSNPQEQAHLDGKRRQRDAADQQHATRVLHNIEAGARQDSPEDAGHPERHRALDTADYLAPEPPSQPAADSPTGSFFEPQIAERLPWLGINSSGININESSITPDDAALGDSPLTMLAAAATAAAAVDASTIAPEAGLGGQAVEGVQQQQVAVDGSGQVDAAKPQDDTSDLLEPWCENP